MTKAYTIGIIVFDGVLTSEAIGPAEVFAIAGQQESLKGTNVLLIGIEQQSTIRTAEGIQLVVDATIYDDLALDVVFVPGGEDMRSLLEHTQLNAFIQKQATTAEWLGSVCSGAFVLGQAGVLDGKQATTWFGGEAMLQSQFPAVQVVHDTPVVVDSRRITANGGLVSYQAALVLLGRLSGMEHAKEVYDSLGLKRLNPWADIEATIVDHVQAPEQQQSDPEYTVTRSVDLEITPGGTVKFEGASYGSLSSFFHAKAEPGKGSELHRHPYPETWIVLSGKARLTVGTQEIEASAGAIAVAGAGIPHKFTNIGTERLELIGIHPSPQIIQEQVGE